MYCLWPPPWEFMTIFFFLLLLQFHHESTGLENKPKQAVAMTWNLLLDVVVQVGQLCGHGNLAEDT